MSEDTRGVAIAATVVYVAVLVIGSCVMLPVNRSLRHRHRKYLRTLRLRLQRRPTTSATAGTLGPVPAEVCDCLPVKTCFSTSSTFLLWAFAFAPSVLFLGVVGPWVCYAYQSHAGAIAFLVCPGALFCVLIVAYCLLTSKDSAELALGSVNAEAYIVSPQGLELRYLAARNEPATEMHYARTTPAELHVTGTPFRTERECWISNGPQRGGSLGPPHYTLPDTEQYPVASSAVDRQFQATAQRFESVDFLSDQGDHEGELNDAFSERALTVITCDDEAGEGGSRGSHSPTATPSLAQRQRRAGILDEFRGNREYYETRMFPVSIVQELVRADEEYAERFPELQAEREVPYSPT